MFRVIIDLKSCSKDSSADFSLSRQVESLQSELDARSLADAQKIKELNEKINKLESKNEELEKNLKNLEKPENFDISLQTDPDTQSESDKITNLNLMIDHLNTQISEMKINHEKEMTDFIVSTPKRR